MLAFAFVLPAVACDRAVLDTLAAPRLDPSGPAVSTGETRQGETELLGANVVVRSAWSVAAWERVLSRPEDEDDWQADAFGTRRVERLDGSHTFRQKDVTLLFGAAHVRRQLVERTEWAERGAQRLRVCWAAVDPAPFAATIRAWAWDGVETLRHGLGEWDLRSLPDGGTSVSYEVWTEALPLPPGMQARLVAEQLPALARAFEQRVGEVTTR